MVLRLSKNGLVRQYGPVSYVINKMSHREHFFIDAEFFLRWIDRHDRDEEIIVANICAQYNGVDPKIVKRDLREFIQPLVEDGIVLMGRSEEDNLRNEVYFSYDHPLGAAASTGADGVVVKKPDVEEYFHTHPQIIDLHIDITQACTERCIHCYFPEHGSVCLPYESVVKVVDEFRGMGGVGLSLSGGECMLHPDFEKIVQYVNSKDLVLYVLSNLTRCDDGKCRVLKECDATVQVSLYSMHPEVHDKITGTQGSFVKTKSAIEKLRAMDVRCRIVCPTMKANYLDYADVLMYAQSLGMEAQTDFVIMGKTNRDTGNLCCRLDEHETRHLLEQCAARSFAVDGEYFHLGRSSSALSDEEWGKNKVCGACVNSLCLNADGTYCPCSGFGGVNLGSCYEHKLDWIWTESPKTLRIRSVVGRDFKKCLHCSDRAYCKICMCCNNNETGDMFTPPEYLCKVAKVNRAVFESRRHMV